MNINLVYSKFAIELNDDTVNHIIIDLQQGLNLTLPLMLKDSVEVKEKNLQLHAILTQINLLSSLIQNELIDKDTVVSLTNSKLLGKYLHMQVLGYLKNNLVTTDNEISLLGYPTTWEVEVAKKFNQIKDNLYYYTK